MANYKSDGWKVVVCTFPKLTPIYRKIGKVTTGPNIAFFLDLSKVLQDSGAAKDLVMLKQKLLPS